MALPLSLPLGLISTTNFAGLQLESVAQPGGDARASRARRAASRRGRQAVVQRERHALVLEHQARVRRGQPHNAAPAARPRILERRRVLADRSVGAAALRAVLAGGRKRQRREQLVDVLDRAAADQRDRAAGCLAQPFQQLQQIASRRALPAGRAANSSSVPSMSRKKAQSAANGGMRRVVMRAAGRSPWRRRAGRRRAGGCACAPRRAASARPSDRR